MVDQPQRGVDDYAGLGNVDHNGAGRTDSRLPVCKDDMHGYKLHWPTSVDLGNTTSWSQQHHLDTQADIHSRFTH